jgi:glycosyltransferase involved in cell wall biosynthesis
MIKVLIIGHVGKPVGGLSMYYESFLNSSIKNKVCLAFIDSMSGTKTFSERGIISLLNLYNAFKIVSKVLYMFWVFRPDLVDLVTSYQTSFLKNSILIILSKLHNKKVILRPRCSIKMFIPEKKSLWRKYTLWVLKLCDGIIVLSSEWDGLHKLIPDVVISRFPNAIDLSSLSLIRRFYEKDFVNILFLGHIGREKGIYELIDAVAMLDKSAVRNFRVYIVGESLKENELAEVEKLIDTQNLYKLIEIRPPVYQEEKIDYFKRSDIFVLPSYHEGMPISIIEAMAAGLPIIATRVGGIPDLIEDNLTGMLIDPKDPVGLSMALKKIIQMKEVRSTMGKAAREKAVKGHEIENYIDSIVSFYYQTLEA